ncbi:MAG: hypothetical protein WBB25_22860 [Sulfitobacter sp.]
MAFENDTNLGRVQKMIETLQLIVKSAQSNRADDDAIRDLLRPLTDELAALGANSPRPVTEQCSAQQKGSWTGKTPQWASVHDMAEQADLKDLTVAMAVYLNRIDEALS